MAFPALIFGAHPTLVDGIEHKIKRRLEPVGDFFRVGHEVEIGRDKADDRGNAIAGDRAVGIGFAKQLHLVRIERQLFICFPQRRPNGGLAFVDAAAWEGNLAGVLAHMFPPNGQNQARLGPVGDRDEHGGEVGFAFLAFDQVADQEVVRRIGCERPGDSIDDAHGANGKNWPSDQMPGGSWPSASAISASS